MSQARGVADQRWEPRCSFPQGVEVPRPIDPAGESGPTRGQAAGPRWRRTSPGLYVPATAPQVPEQRIVEAALRLRGRGAVTGWAGCRLWGAAFHDGFEPDGTTPIPVPMAVGSHGCVRRHSSIEVSYERLPAEEVVLRHGIRTTEIRRSVFDAMRRVDDVVEAVVAVENALMAELVSREEMAEYVASHAGARGIELARQAVALASEHSRSPNEPRLRMIAVRHAGLPQDLEVNCPVHDRDGRFLGEADLLDEEAGLVIEFDGADHRNVGRQSRDVVKDDLLRDSGLEVIRVTGPQLRDVPALVARLQAARRRARFLSPSARRWEARPRADGLHARLHERRAMADLHAQWVREGVGGL